MSRKSKAEYIKVRRQRYEVASPARKSRIIDEVMDTTGFTRKYVVDYAKMFRCYITPYIYENS